jgi:glycosyltransferase involved in cell wall biosynthesis
MIKKKSIFCITVKNEAKNLKILFEVLKNNLKIFNDYFLIFVESDSNDDSAYLIKDFL